MDVLIPPLYWALLLIVTASTVYQLLCLVSAADFFRAAARPPPSGPSFTPPVSVLKPLRGVDDGTESCLASFCRQDYPDYEVIFGVRDAADPAVALVARLRSRFPGRRIKLVVNPARVGASAKVSNLHNMLRAAEHETLVLSDCDARVGPDYLRAVVGPLADRGTGLVTCLYRPTGHTNFAALMEALGLTGEFAPGVLVARRLDGVKFAFGASIATRRGVLEGFGGFAAIADYLGDDFLVGNLTAAAGYRVELSPYVVETFIPRYRWGEMFRHQLRWARSTRHRRPLGYLGLLFTHTAPLAFLALALFPAAGPARAAGLAGLATRFLAAWLIGCVGFRDLCLRRYFYLLPARDLLSFVVWLVGFAGNTVHWCGDRYRLEARGRLVPLAPEGGAGTQK